MSRLKITPEMYATIPAMVEAGMTREEIAVKFGVKPESLAVMCSKARISLRRGGRLLPREASEVPKRCVVTLSERAGEGIREKAKAMGISDLKLAKNLLEVIVNDNLYDAVLDL